MICQPWLLAKWQSRGFWETIVWSNISLAKNTRRKRYICGSTNTITVFATGKYFKERKSTRSGLLLVTILWLTDKVWTEWFFALGHKNQFPDSAVNVVSTFSLGILRLRRNCAHVHTYTYIHTRAHTYTSMRASISIASTLIHRCQHIIELEN